jgi:hypothetical protein
VIEALTGHFSALLYWFENDGAENWSKMTPRWRDQASHTLLRTCPKMTNIVVFECKCLEVLLKGCLTRYLFNIQPPCPVDLNFWCSQKTTFQTPTHQPKEHGSIFDVFMSISVEKCL